MIPTNNPKVDPLKPIKELTKEWIAWYSKPKKDGRISKPPLFQKGYTIKKGAYGKSYEKAWQDVKKCIKDENIEEVKSGGVGLLMNDRHPFVCFDLDDTSSLEDLPSDEFKLWLSVKDSYTEESPSGNGFRIIFLCPDKHKLEGKGCPALIKSLCGKGSLYIDSGYVTITEKDSIGEQIVNVMANELEQWIKPKAEVISLEKQEGYKPAFRPDIPDINKIKEYLGYCKLDQNERVIEAYRTITGQEYDHYHYWLNILAACHHYANETGQMNEVTNLVIEWSKTDPTDFDDEDTVIKKWESFSFKENPTTISTLIKYANLLKFQWPEEKYDNKGNPTGKPIPAAVENFEYLMEYYNIKIYVDYFGNERYIAANEEVMNYIRKTNNDVIVFFGKVGPFDEKHVKAIMERFAQKQGYSNVSISLIGNLYNNYIKGREILFDSFKSWVETPPDKLPDDMIEKDTDISKSNIDYLISCIDFVDRQNPELAKIYLNAAFYELTMPIYNPKRLRSERDFIIILSGVQGNHKTSFCKSLFPPQLKRKYITSPIERMLSDKSARDINKALVSSKIVILDEIDMLFNKETDSMFKAMVSTDDKDGIDIYEKSFTKKDRHAVIMGTTNKTTFVFEQNANRRLGIIEVKWIDTDAMDKINWHHFYREYVKNGKKLMMNGQFPWKITDKRTKELQAEANEMYRAKTYLEIMIREIWDFDMEIHSKPTPWDVPNMQNNSNFYSLTQVIGTIKQRNPDYRPNKPELIHVLKRMCGLYTKTTNKQIFLTSSSSTKIENGLLSQSDKKKYVMPPIKTEAFDT